MHRQIYLKTFFLFIIITFFLPQLSSEQDSSLLHVGRGRIEYAVWNPIRSVLAVSSPTGVWIYDAAFEDIANLRNLRGQLSWSSDGTRLAGVENGGNLWIWDIETKQSHVLRESGQYGAVVWSPDGTRVLGKGTNEATLIVWDVNTGEMLLIFQDYVGRYNGFAWSTDGTRIIGSGSNNTALVWDASTGSLLATLQHNREIRYMTWNSNDTRVACVDIDGNVYLWNAISYEHLATWQQENWVPEITWSPNGSYLVSSGGRRVDVWNTQTYEHSAILVPQRRFDAPAVWSPDGLYLVTGDADGTVRVWETSTWELALMLEEHFGLFSDLKAIDWCSDDGQLSLIVVSAHTAHKWDVVMGELKRSLAKHQADIQDIAWSSDNRRIAVNVDGKVLQIWDVVTEELVGFWETANYAWPDTRDTWPEDRQRPFAWLSNNTLLLKEHDDKLHVWNITTNELVNTPSEFSNKQYTLIGRVNDAELVLLGYEKGDETSQLWKAEVWDIQNWQLKKTWNLMTESGLARTVTTWNPDNTQLAYISNDDAVKILDIETGQITVNWEITEGMSLISYIEWSPTGDRIAGIGFAELPTLYVWDVETGQVEVVGSVSTVAWSPDGKQLVVLEYSRYDIAEIIDLADSQSMTLKGYQAEGYEDALTAIAWSPDGTMIAGAGNLGLIIWKQQIN